MVRIRSDVLVAFIALVLLVPRSSSAKLRVVATTTTLAELARRVGGDRVEVKSLVPPQADAGRMGTLPSMSLELSRADLLIAVGNGLEAAWLPSALLEARNIRVEGAEGQLVIVGDGHILVGPAQISQRTAAATLVRAPRPWLAPDGAVAIARQIATRLGTLDPGGRDEYARAADAFAAEVARRRYIWETTAKRLRGVGFVGYDSSWSPLASWLGMVELGEVDDGNAWPRAVGGTDGAALLLCDSFTNLSRAERVAARARLRLVRLATEVDAVDATHDYFALMDHLVAELAAAAP